MRSRLLCALLTKKCCAIKVIYNAVVYTTKLLTDENRSQTEAEFYSSSFHSLAHWPRSKNTTHQTRISAHRKLVHFRQLVRNFASDHTVAPHHPFPIAYKLYTQGPNMKITCINFPLSLTGPACRFNDSLILPE